MSKHVQTTIRYDGPSLVGHDMDVQDLAPALLAVAEIAQIANRELNGEKANLRVLVNADAEQKCFQIDLSLVQSLLDQAHSLLGKDTVATARNIAEVIGLVGAPAGGVFGLYKWLYGRKEDAGSGDITYTENQATGTTIVNITGDGNSVEVTNQVAVLASKPEVMKHVQTVLKPLQKEGYDEFAVVSGDKPIVTIDKSEASNIIAAKRPEPLTIEDDESGEDTTATGPAWVDTSHFRGQAKWALLWSGQRIDAKMPEEFIAKFQDNELIVVPNTKLTVRMRITNKLDRNGAPTGFADFEVEEVLRIDHPPKAAQQMDLLDD